MSLDRAQIHKLLQGGYIVFDAGHGPDDYRNAVAGFSKLEEALEFLRVEMMPEEERKNLEAQKHQGRMMSNSSSTGSLGEVKWMTL